MGATWMSWRTAVTVITTLLQIRGLMSVTTKAVEGVEGQPLSFRCEYPQSETDSQVKFFYRVDDSVSNTLEKRNQWQQHGRFSLYDNTTGSFVIIRVDKLIPEDSGTYWCVVDVSSRPDHITVIHLNVVKANLEDNPSQYATPPPFLPAEFNNPLFLTAVMCVAAMLFVCFFTLCLLLTVKHKQSVPRPNRQISADYETMMPGVQTEPDRCCTCPDCTELSALSQPSPDLLFSNFKPKQRESTVTLGIGEYVDVDSPGYLCPYQHLDVNHLEENVYHSLQGNPGLKDERPKGVK